MSYFPYQQKLLDPRWQKRRLEILNRDDWTCQQCKEKTKTLHVHHLAYRDDEPWEIEDDLLVTLCGDCHENEGAEHRNSIACFLSVLARTGIRFSLDLDLLGGEIERAWCDQATGNAKDAWITGVQAYFDRWHSKASP